MENRKFTPEYWDEIDAGFDFYAPQMFRGQFGEALLFGWFGCGDQSLPTDKDMWRHALTLPRELHVKENRLYANPVKAVAETFGEPLLLKEGESMMPESMTYRMDVTVSPEEKKTLVFGEDADFWTLTLNAADGVITADRSTLEQKVDPAYGEKRVCRVEPQKEMQVQIFSDNSFVELYINGGEKVMSLRTFQKSRSVCMRKGE